MYRGCCPRVNTPGRLTRLQRTGALTLLSLTQAALIAGGCAATGPQARVAPPIIAVRYDVEPVFVGAAHETALDQIRQDFERLAALGFTHVVLYYVDRSDGRRLLEIAHGFSLSLILPLPMLDHFVRTGGLPPGCRGPGDLAGMVPQQILSHAGLAAIAVNPGSTRRTAERAAALAAAVQSRGIACVAVGNVAVDCGVVRPTTIDTDLAGSELDDSPLEPWLAQYHEGLVAGRTDGVVFDQFRTLAGAGMLSKEVPLTPARIAALRRLLIRVQAWGPRLHGLSATPIKAEVQGTGSLKLIALTRGPTRYVLAFNRSRHDYARFRLRLPETIHGAGVSRAVEVPASSSEKPGRVLHAGSEGILIPIDLRPGDAVLFEVF